MNQHGPLNISLDNVGVPGGKESAHDVRFGLQVRKGGLLVAICATQVVFHRQQRIQNYDTSTTGFGGWLQDPDVIFAVNAALGAPLQPTQPPQHSLGFSRQLFTVFPVVLWENVRRGTDRRLWSITRYSQNFVPFVVCHALWQFGCFIGSALFPKLNQPN